MGRWKGCRPAISPQPIIWIRGAKKSALAAPHPEPSPHAETLQRLNAAASTLPPPAPTLAPRIVLRSCDRNAAASTLPPALLTQFLHFDAEGAPRDLGPRGRGAAVCSPSWRSSASPRTARTRSGLRTAATARPPLRIDHLRRLPSAVRSVLPMATLGRDGVEGFREESRVFARDVELWHAGCWRWVLRTAGDKLGAQSSRRTA